MSDNAAAIAPGCVTSAARQPARPYSDATALARSRFEPSTTTSAPALLAWMAVDKPIPEVPPTIGTVQPSSWRGKRFGAFIGGPAFAYRFRRRAVLMFREAWASARPLSDRDAALAAPPASSQALRHPSDRQG